MCICKRIQNFLKVILCCPETKSVAAIIYYFSDCIMVHGMICYKWQAWHIPENSLSSCPIFPILLATNWQSHKRQKYTWRTVPDILYTFQILGKVFLPIRKYALKPHGLHLGISYSTCQCPVERISPPSPDLSTAWHFPEVTKGHSFFSCFNSYQQKFQ